MTRPKNKRLSFRLHRGGTQPPSSGPELLLLEHFSDANLQQWQQQAAALQAYHYQWFFELESQRAANHARLCEALAGVGGISIDLAGWGRALEWQFALHPLSVVGSLKWVGGRFNYGAQIDETRFAPFPALYIGRDFETCYRELKGVPSTAKFSGLTSDELALCAKTGMTWVPVEGKINNVFDLTKKKCIKDFAAIIANFSISNRIRELEKLLGLVAPLKLIASTKLLMASLMEVDWRHWPVQFSIPANCQVFGNLLATAGFDAVLYKSTKTLQNSLAIFTRNLKKSDSVVRVIAPAPSGVAVTELSSANWQHAEGIFTPP